MKCYTQVYVMNSMEAVKTYGRAFGAEVTFAIKNETQTAYAHCELSVNGDPILAVAEAPEAYDVSVIHRMKWQTMQNTAVAHRRSWRYPMLLLRQQREQRDNRKKFLAIFYKKNKTYYID